MGLSHAEMARRYGYGQLSRWLADYTNMFYGRPAEGLRVGTRAFPHKVVSLLAAEHARNSGER